MTQLHQNCKFGEISPHGLENTEFSKFRDTHAGGHTDTYTDNSKILYLQHLTVAEAKNRTLEQLNQRYIGNNDHCTSIVLQIHYEYLRTFDT